MKKFFSVLSWVFSVLFFLAFLGSLFSGEYLSAFIFLVITGFILPPLNKWLISKHKSFDVPGWQKTLYVIILLFLASSLGDKTTSYYTIVDKTNIYKTIENKEVLETLPKYSEIVIIEESEESGFIKTKKKTWVSAKDISPAKYISMYTKNQPTNIYNDLEEKKVLETVNKFTELRVWLPSLATTSNYVQIHKDDSDSYVKRDNLFEGNEKEFLAFLAKLQAEQEKIAKEKARKKSISDQFSAWNGAHINLEKYIKSSMHDPSSYKHVETVYWDKKTHLIVQTTFRGKNAFGGIVKNSVKAMVGLNGKIWKILE